MVKMKKNNKLRISYGSIALIVFSMGIVLWKYGPSGTILRNYGGDVLIIIFIYFTGKIFFRFPLPFWALAVFLFSVFVEILQFYNTGEMLNLSNEIISLTLGNTFDPGDIIAYLTGAILSIVMDYVIMRNIK